MKRSSKVNLKGNEFDYYSKEILKEDKPLNFNIEKKKSVNYSQIKEISPMRKSISIKSTEKKIGSTEFNNLRFEADPSENKKQLRRSSTNNSLDMRSSFNNLNNNIEIKSSVNNLNSINENYQSLELEKFSPVKSAHKTPDKVNDYSSNLFSANIKNMQDIQNNNFEVEDEDIIKDIPKPYKIRAKKPTWKAVPVGFSNTKMKFLPDHVAFNVVDNLINPKIYDDA